MKVLILRSEKTAARESPTHPYLQHFSSSYAEKVIGNLTGDDRFCTACGPDCLHCRRGYNRKFGDDIAGVIAFPAALPHLLENPEDHLPRALPQHDIMLAINIHEQILLEILKRCAEAGTRGIVAPMEAPGWVSGSARTEAKTLCRENNIEVSFPEPFCDFDPPSGSTLAEFRERFHIGKPEVALDIRHNRIKDARVEISAPCGATYYVARWLLGKHLDDDLKHEVVSKRLHSYPCTASMKWDDEIGDTPLHVAALAHYEILAQLKKKAQEDRGMMMSPTGQMIPRPAPLQENLKNVETAKAAILETLSDGKAVSLHSLKEKQEITPAALHSALLILKQEGKIRTAGGNITAI